MEYYIYYKYLYSTTSLKRGLNLMNWNPTSRYLDIYVNEKLVHYLSKEYPGSPKKVDIFDFLLNSESTHQWTSMLGNGNLSKSFNNIFPNIPQTDAFSTLGKHLSKPTSGDEGAFADAFAIKLKSMRSTVGVLLHIKLDITNAISNTGSPKPPGDLGHSDYWDKIIYNQ